MHLQPDINAHAHEHNRKPKRYAPSPAFQRRGVEQLAEGQAKAGPYQGGIALAGGLPAGRPQSFGASPVLADRARLADRPAPAPLAGPGGRAAGRGPGIALALRARPARSFQRQPGLGAPRHLAPSPTVASAKRARTSPRSAPVTLATSIRAALAR